MSRLSELSRLIDTSRRSGTDVRPTLLKILADLFVETPARSIAESDRFCELALRLIDVADLATRQAVAARLAPCPYVPKPVLIRLALDDFSVAGPLIATSPRMDSDLLATLDVVAGPKHRLAIAARRATDQLDQPAPVEPPAPEIPAATAQEAVAESVGESVAHTLTQAVEASRPVFAPSGEDFLFEIRAIAAPESNDEPLSLPADLPEMRLPPMPVFIAPPEPVTLPHTAPDSEPFAQVELVPAAPAIVATPAVTAPVAADARPLAVLIADPAASMASISAAFLGAEEKARLDALASLTLSGRPAALIPTKAAGIDMGRALESAALHRKVDQFAQLLGEALTLSPDVASQIVRDNGGEAVVAALRALDIESELVLRIMLFLNPQIGVSVTRVFALSSLYDQLDRHVALQLVAGWQAMGRAVVAHKPVRHVAVTAPEASAPVRVSAVPVRRAVTVPALQTGTQNR